MLMVANDSVPEFWHWSGRMPGCVGHLYTPPDGQRGPFPFMPYALDNGAYVAWKHNRDFPEVPWRALLEWGATRSQRPLWAAVPDVVADRDRTLERWDKYSGDVLAAGLRPAFVAQDGMTFADVPNDDCMIFIGGTDLFKLPAIEPWCRRFPGRVHVGRVNFTDRLELCRASGAVSVDGTGWWHDKMPRGERGTPQRQQLVSFWEAEERRRNERKAA